MKPAALILLGALLGATFTARASGPNDLTRLVAAVERIARALERCK